MDNETHLTPSQIEAYQSQGLPARDRLAMDDHIAQCGACRDAVRRAADLPLAAEAARSLIAGALAAGTEHLDYVALAAYAQGTIGDARAVRMHLDECEMCRNEAEDLVMLSAEIGSRSVPSSFEISRATAGAGSRFWSREGLRVYAYAATIVIALLLGAVASFLAVGVDARRQERRDQAVIAALDRRMALLPRNLPIDAAVDARPPEPSRRATSQPRGRLATRPRRLSAPHEGGSRARLPKPLLIAAAPAAPAGDEGETVLDDGAAAIVLLPSGDIERRERMPIPPAAPPALQMAGHLPLPMGDQSPERPAAAGEASAGAASPLSSAADAAPTDVSQQVAPPQIRAFAAPRMRSALHPPLSLAKPAPGAAVAGAPQGSAVAAAPAAPASPSPTAGQRPQEYAAIAMQRYAGQPLSLGVALALDGDVERARDELRRYLKARPGDRGASRLLARLEAASAR